MQSELAAPTNGAGLTTLQQAYDNSPTPGAQILLDAVPNPLSVQANVAGDIFLVKDIAGNNVLQVQANPDRVEVDGSLTIQDAFQNAGSPNSIIIDDTFSSGGAFIGASILSSGTLTSTVSTTWIWSLVQDAKLYQMGVNPAFAAWALFNVLCTIENAGNFNLVQAIILNNGSKHRRATSGTSTTVQNVGLSNSPNMQAAVSGAVLTKTTGDTAVDHRSTFITVNGSTINGGTNRCSNYRQPAVALFGTQNGVENYTALVAHDVQALPGFGNIVKAALRSAIGPTGTNAWFLLNNGNAHSDHGAGHIYFDDNAGIALGGVSNLSFDYWATWNAAGYFRQFFNTAFNNELRWSNPGANRFLFDNDGGSVSGQYNWNCAQFSIGANAGALGSGVGQFVTPARTIAVGGEWADFILTQAADLTVNGQVMSRIAGWVINHPSYANSTGSTANSDTLTVGGFVTSAPGVTITERQSLNVIGGRSRHQAAMQFDPINPAALASGNNNDWAGLLTGTANNGMRHWARISGNATTSVLTGIDATAVQDGDTFELTNVSANAIDISHQDAASAAANRIISPSGATYVLAADETVLVRYDLATTRWRLLGGTGA